MSMAEYMYKLMYGRKMGRSCYKIRHNGYIGGGGGANYCYSNDVADCNMSCSYAQNSYPQNEVAYHDIYPLWMGGGGGGILDSDAAQDDGKGPRGASPSPSTACPTPWINYWSGDAEDQGYAGPERASTTTVVDIDAFYKIPPSADGHPVSEAVPTEDNMGASSSPNNRVVPKLCRFNSPSASVESSDEAPKFSHTLQFQMAQHIWDSAPADMETVEAQCHQEGTVANMGSYTLGPDGGGGEGTYSPSSSSCASSVRTSAHSDGGLLYPYSPCRSASFSLNLFAGEFSQPEFAYRVPIVDCGAPNKAEDDQCIMAAAAAYQRWGPHHHHMGPHAGPHEADAGFCDGGGPMGMYACPFGGCPKIGVPGGGGGGGGLDPVEFQTGFAMMTPAGKQDVKQETKGIVRRSRYQLNSFDPLSPFIGGASASAASSSSIPVSSSPSSSSSSSSSAAVSASFAQQQQQQLKTSAPLSAASSLAHSSRNLLLRPEVKLLREQSQMCAVCGDNAACQHYGVRTCEGCKGFFKRTVQKGSKYVCLSGNNCPIDKRRRNRCQFCRFKKCLTVGMVKEVVRTDSLKGRRGRLPSKVKHLGQGQVPPMTTTHTNPDSYQLNLISGLLRAHVDTSPDFLNLDYSLFRSPAEDEEDADVCSTSRESVEQLYRLLGDIGGLVRRWAERVPGFRQLVNEDQEALLHGSLLELILLRTSLGVEPKDDRVTFSTGLVLHRRQCVEAFGPWIERIVDFGKSLKSLEADLPTIACLSALVLLQANKKLLKEPETVSSLHANFKNALKAHCHGQGKQHLVPVLAEKLAELKHLSGEGIARLTTLRTIVEIPAASPLQQMLNGEADVSR